MAKNNHKVGESLPLARTSSLATPSSGGHPRNAPESAPLVAPYELPDGWKGSRLGDCATYINGRAFKPEEWETQGKPIIRIQNLTNTSDSVNRTTKQFEEKYLIKNNDLLYAWSASLGAHIWHDEDGWLNQHIFKVVPNDQISKMYLYYSLVRVTDNLYAKAHGSGMVHVTLKPFLNTTIPLPPTLAEQQRIVNRIETMFAKLDQAQEKAQAVLDSFETRKAAILHKAFTGELTASWRKENGVLDDSWEEKKLEEVCDFITKGTTPKKEDMSIGTGDIPYIKVYNLCFDTNLDFTIDPTFVKLESHKTFLARSITLPGDVLMNIVGPPFGKISIVPDTYPEWNINQAIARFRCKPELYNVYLANYLISPKTNENMSRQIKTTAGQQNLTLEICRNMTIPVPSLPEQQEIVRILDTVLEKESRAKEAAGAVLYQIALLKKSILARAFRGKI